MKRLMVAGPAGLSCLGLLVTALSAKALMIAPAPVPQRVATAQVVVVGKVTGFADKMVSAPRFPGDKEKAEFQVAIVKIEDALVGAKGLKEIRVGFLPPPPAVPPGGDGGPVIRPPIRRFPQANLALGQEACLFLVKHPDADFYTLPAYFSIIDKKNADFAASVAEVKTSARLLADPKAGLESKKADERLLTAALLINRYRTPMPTAAGAPKTEPIDAAQSKLILLALADAEWKEAPGGRPGFFQMSPQNLFFRLELQPKDGWKQPADFKEFPEAAKKWLKDHADTYRIERFVAEEKKTDK